jgi:hypothetical protein
MKSHPYLRAKFELMEELVSPFMSFLCPHIILYHFVQYKMEEETGIGSELSVNMSHLWWTPCRNAHRLFIAFVTRNYHAVR